MVALYETDKGKEMCMSGKKYRIAAQDRKDILMGAEGEPQGRFATDRITVDGGYMHKGEPNAERRLSGCG